MFCMLMHGAMMGSHGGQQAAHAGPAPSGAGDLHAAHPASALELLKLRYVKGEITRAQFEEMRQVLAEAGQEG